MRRSGENCCFGALFMLLFLVGAHEAASNASPIFSPQRIRQWIQHKCGQDGCSVWVYEGALYDPLDGHKIANVEGLELVRRLSDSSDPTTVSRSKELKANKIQGDYSATLLSRKLFCYQSPKQPRRLLDSIRLRPNAPRRNIPTSQAVALYDSATTYVSRNKGKDLILHTEWPNGKCTWGTASPQKTSAPNDKQSFDFNVFSKPNSQQDVPDITASTSLNAEEIVVTPKRSQLIQFGTSSQQSDQSKFGVRETYSYTMEPSPYPRDWLDRVFRRARKNDNDSIRVKYTRYGEGPPWYGPGKYCMLELEGRRAKSVEEAPPLAASVAAERVPGFLSVDAPIASDVSAKRAVEWFRQGYLQLLMEEQGDEEQRLPDGKLKRLGYRVKKKSGQVFQRMRAASTLEPSTT